jgi:hypothetical protein
MPVAVSIKAISLDFSAYPKEISRYPASCNLSVLLPVCILLIPSDSALALL